MKRAVLLFAALFLAVQPLTPQEPKVDAAWEPLRFLLLTSTPARGEYEGHLPPTHSGANSERDGVSDAAAAAK